MQKVNDYFKDYPASQEVFQTADGFLFHKKGDAVSYAATLKDKEVTEHKREGAKAENTADAGGNKETEQAEQKKAPAKGGRKASDKPTDTKGTTEGAGDAGSKADK